jgi:hypothetical protein
MKIKLLLLFLILLLSDFSGLACDVCGCSLGGNYFGLLPLYNKNFVGLRWSQAKFNAYMDHHSEYFQKEYSHDTYHKVELWGRFNISPRLQLFAFVPYNYNDMDGNIQDVRASGLGDVTLMANYLLFKTTDDSKSLKHMITVGGGLKLPTGKHDDTDQGKLVNPNFQLGTGSVDFLLNAVYTVRYKQVGVNVETGYKINTRNTDDYLFGNQHYLSSQVFYSKKLGIFTLLPNAGIYYERASHHKDGASVLTNTGGYALFLSTGLETYVAAFSFGVNYKTPLKQQYNSDSIADIEAADRWTVGVTYSIASQRRPEKPATR